MPPTPAQLLRKALGLHRRGDRAGAERLYREVVARDPGHPHAWQLLGVLASEQGEHERALDLFSRAITLDAGNAIAFQNRGLALHALGRAAEALADFTRATELQPELGGAHSNRGQVLFEMGRFADALASLDEAIALAPELAQAHYNRGNALQQLRRLLEALESYDRALALDPRFAAAWSNRGHALQSLGAHREAVDSFERAYALEPGMPFLEGLLLFAKLNACDWSSFDEALASLRRRVAAGERAVHPFALLAMLDDPALQRDAAETYVRSRLRQSRDLGAIPPRMHGPKIRVGYFSGDFREHSVAYLTAGVFEAHDRARFEITGFAFGPPSEDPMRQRLAGAFDRFVDVGNASDREIAALARSLEIDIAMDLGGHTRESRTGIFAYRAAPLQASYAGYLGTMGAPYYDYLFADATLVAERDRAHYTEKIALLPSYQANDWKRPVAERSFTRDELELPDAGFAFCCLNNSYKITPPVFRTWMRILAQVPGSVLMLYASDPDAASNLRGEAVRAGIEPARIVFAERLPRPEYLSRFRSLSLYLDTHPYGAGTVASDALWAGLPVLARMGRSFASRMAASVLAAAGLAELIAASDAVYEALALELAWNPGRLARIRSALEAARGNALLFDTASFTRHIEAAYGAMVERHRSGLPPEHIVVRP